MHLGEKRAFSHTYIATTKYSDRQKWINKKVTTLHILKVDACCIYSIILHLLLLFSVCMFIFMLNLFMGEKSVKRLSCSFCLFFSFAGMFFSIVKFTWSWFLEAAFPMFDHTEARTHVKYEDLSPRHKIPQTMLNVFHVINYQVVFLRLQGKLLLHLWLIVEKPFLILVFIHLKIDEWGR